MVVTNDVETAVAVHHTFEELHCSAASDSAVLAMLNKDARFWMTQSHCLQASLFITLSRIFDTRSRAQSVHALVNATIGNIGLFSANDLRTRKMEIAHNLAWLDEYIAGAWIPTKPADLRHLKTALAGHHTRFEKIYQPIRHAIFAHRLMSDADASMKYFGDTNRTTSQPSLTFCMI
jgi:hypothetical protein